MSVFHRHDDGPVPTVLEAQGLAWLAEAMVDSRAHMVPVTNGPGWLEEPRLTTTTVTPAGAGVFGRALAVTRAASAPAFGAAPPGQGGRVQMGCSDIRLRLHAVEGDELRRWGELYAEGRILPYLQPSRDNDSTSVGGVHIVEQLCERLRDGDFDTDQPALVRTGTREHGARVAMARTHGDLWYGNVLWTPAGETTRWAPRRAGLKPRELDSWQAPISGMAGGSMVVGVLIDSMAQGAHAETDLATLGVFGQCYLGRVYTTCHEISPLTEDWCERVGLHSWRIIMIHAFLFGGDYGGEAVAVTRQYL